MLEAVIIDDEQNNIDNLAILLKKYCPLVRIVGTAGCVREAKALIEQVEPTLLFLDIQMPGQNGFDLLKAIHKNSFEVIFVTAFDQYAIQAIKASAIDYLLKPINPIELVNAVNRALDAGKMRTQNHRLQSLIRSIGSNSQPRIAIAGNKETVFIDPQTILFCKSDNNYTHFYLTHQQRHISSKPIFDYEELLSVHGFVRCHQSYLVNMAFVKSWIKAGGDRLLLNGAHEIPIARNRKQQVKKVMGLR